MQFFLVLVWLFVGDDVPAYKVVEVQLPDLDPSNPFFRVATCSENNGGMAATGVLYLVLVAGGTYFAYRTRKAPIEFNESTQILACIAFLTFYALLIVPLFFIIRQVRVSKDSCNANTVPNRVLPCSVVAQFCCLVPLLPRSIVASFHCYLVPL